MLQKIMGHDIKQDVASDWRRAPNTASIIERNADQTWNVLVHASLHKERQCPVDIKDHTNKVSLLQAAEMF